MPVACDTSPTDYIFKHNSMPVVALVSDVLLHEGSGIQILLGAQEKQKNGRYKVDNLMQFS